LHLIIFIIQKVAKVAVSKINLVLKKKETLNFYV